MSRVSSVILFSLMLAACSNPFDKTAEKKPSAQEIATANEAECKGRAESRLKLFDRPDTYPISPNEKKNAYLSLYNECMKGFETQIVSGKPGFEHAALMAENSNLANLSPAAGGTAGPAQQGVTTLPNGVVVIDPTRLTALSPAAGGVTATGSGSTVVVVQAPPSSTSITLPPIPAQPVSIPVNDAGVAAASPTAVQKPAEPPKETMAAQPAEKTKKRLRKRPKTAAKAETPGDTRSRFEKNAVPLVIDLKPKAADMNAAEPSAGQTLDHAVATGKPPAKE